MTGNNERPKPAPPTGMGAGEHAVTAAGIQHLFRAPDGTYANQTQLGVFFKRCRDEGCALHIDPLLYSKIVGYIESVMAPKKLGPGMAPSLMGVPCMKMTQVPGTEMWVVPIRKKVPWVERWVIAPGSGDINRIERILKSGATRGMEF